MLKEELPYALRQVVSAADEVARDVLAPAAEAVDEKAVWPHPRARQCRHPARRGHSR